MRTFISFLCVILFAPPACAGVNIPITVNVSDAVTVTGTPRITVDVGGTTRYATYTSGTGTNTLTFTLSPLSRDVDMDGITGMSPIHLNGGTITDLSDNAATLTFTPPDTSNVKINAAIPSGYTTSFTDRTVTNVNKSNASFSFTYNKTGRTYHYTISSSGGGTPRHLGQGVARGIHPRHTGEAGFPYEGRLEGFQHGECASTISGPMPSPGISVAAMGPLDSLVILGFPPGWGLAPARNRSQEKR